MIRQRPWTTGLDNSIRLLSPTLVHGVISGATSAGCAGLALQFFRFAYRWGGFRPEGGTFALLVPALASRRMLNHARCLILDTMPSFSIALDEPTQAALISASNAGRRMRAPSLRLARRPSRASAAAMLAQAAVREHSSAVGRLVLSSDGGGGELTSVSVRVRIPD
jgi:hypothetical protein